MGLLADLVAYDLGYLPATSFLARTGRTLETMQHLRRYRGHFYNWYHTRTLQPAEPRYVSSVDSGNLWGALCVLRVGLEELPQRPLVHPRLLQGLQDTLAVIAALRDPLRSSASDRFDACLAELHNACAEPLPDRASGVYQRFSRLHALAAELAACAPADGSAVQQWTRCLAEQCAATYDELSQLAFWVHLPASLGERAQAMGDGQASCPAPIAGAGSDAAVDGDAGVETERTLAAALLPAERRVLDDLTERLDRLDTGCTLSELPHAAEQAIAQIGVLTELLASNNGETDGSRRRLRSLLSLAGKAAERAVAAARAELRQSAALADVCQQCAAMDFRFLFDRERRLLAIGFHVGQRRRDTSHYDLLASEARLTSFLAISHGQLPQDHWFALGRVVTFAAGKLALLSWSGSMFEYLMPSLLMPCYPGTLLDAGCRAAVARQIRYARQRGVPWGMSESCYQRTDANLVYQYRAFGVPGLGFASGLGEHLVIAPYATALALPLAPRAACVNLTRLERLGYLSPWGFYDAIDYTPRHCLPANQPAPCRTVMAHHSGMTLLALAGALLGNPLQQRFLKNPLCRAHDLLLQERVSQAVRPADPDALNNHGWDGAEAERVLVRPFVPDPDATSQHADKV
jgi:hypothetical protein